MTKFDPQFFRSFEFTQELIERYLANAWRDFEIARKDDFVEVKFNYGYQALIKGAIALIAKVGAVKVRSIPGHHIKILEKASEILENSDIDVIGNVMRTKRNLDLYEGGLHIGQNEVREYLQFVENVLKAVQSFLLKK